MTRVPIAVQPCPYDAIIENGLVERAGEHLRGRVGNRQHLFVVTVPPVRRRWGKKLMRSLGSAGLQSRLIEMRDGESGPRSFGSLKFGGSVENLRLVWPLPSAAWQSSQAA